MMKPHMSNDGRLCDVDNCEHLQERRRQERLRTSVNVTILCCMSAYWAVSVLAMGWAAAAFAILLVPCGIALSDGLLADRMWMF
jgi:fatty acid desaturase